MYFDQGYLCVLYFVLFYCQTSTSGQLRISETISSIWKNESWRGFFAGNGANCLRVLPFSALVCLAYYNMAKVSTVGIWYACNYI